MRSGRSLAHLGSDDLVRLAGLAAEAEAGLFASNPHGAGAGWYAGGLVCRALCQGAACTIWMARSASRTSTCSPSAPSATMARFVPVAPCSGRLASLNAAARPLSPARVY